MKDTQTTTFLEDRFNEHPNCYDGWSEDYVLLIIQEALKEMKYEGETNEISLTKYACREVDQGNSRSEICYVETEPGFFYIMRDMSDHINVVYNRWD